MLNYHEINLKSVTYNKNIYMVIWKTSHSNHFKPAFCCRWCLGLIKKHKYHYKNVYTINYKEKQTGYNYKLVSAIDYNHPNVNPLKKNFQKSVIL